MKRRPPSSARSRAMIWTAGDNVYPTGTAANFTNCYEPSWGGAIKARTRPVPGNHDWDSSGADSLAGYFGYYGANATDLGGKSYYSYDIAGSNWHVVNLDSECADVPGGCAAGSAQELWLRADLAANSAKNVIAVWHKPRFSSGVTNLADLQAFYDDIYEFGVDILLDGHDHIYERLAPMDPSGAADPTYGIRQFTVGTGGAALQTCPTRQSLDRPVRSATAPTYGVLKFTLHATTYDWTFLPIAGGTFTDFGSGSVHDAPPVANSAPAGRRRRVHHAGRHRPQHRRTRRPRQRQRSQPGLPDGGPRRGRQPWVADAQRRRQLPLYPDRRLQRARQLHLPRQRRHARLERRHRVDRGWQQCPRARRSLVCPLRRSRQARPRPVHDRDLVQMGRNRHVEHDGNRRDSQPDPAPDPRCT